MANLTPLAPTFTAADTRPAPTSIGEARKRVANALKPLAPQHREYAKQLARLGNMKAAWCAATGNEQMCGAASRLAAKPAMRRAVDAIVMLEAMETGATPEGLTALAAAMAFVDPLELFNEDGTGKRLSEIPLSARRAIQRVRAKSTTRKRGKAVVVTVETEFVIADRVKPLELLMRSHGMLAADNAQKGFAAGAGLATLIEKMQADNVIEPMD